MPVPALLEQDARLNRFVSLQVTEISLSDLLRQLSEPNLLLKADDNSANQKLQIRLKQRPLRSLFQAVAELVPGEWISRSDGKGYVFRMQGKAVMARTAWWQLFLNERERALAAQRESVLQQLRTPPQRQEIKPPNVEGATPEMQDDDLAHQHFFNILPGPLQASIASHVTDFASFIGYYTHGANEGAIVVPVSDLPEEARAMLRKEYALLWTSQHVQPKETTITFANMGNIVETSFNLPNGLVNDSRIHLMVQVPLQATLLPLEHAGLVQVVQKLGRLAPPDWKTLAAYQQRRVWPNDAPPFIPSKRRPRRADWLNWLAAYDDMEYVADYYSRRGFPMQSDAKQQPPSHPLKAELDAFAVQYDSSWKQATNGLYLVRDNRWYRDDLLEVPDALLTRWLASLRVLAEQIYPGGKPANRILEGAELLDVVRKQLAWESEVAMTLTPWQIAHGLNWAAYETLPVRRAEAAKGEKPGNLNSRNPATTPSGFQEINADPMLNADVTMPFSSIAERILKQRHAEMFYASLSEPQQTALLQDVLPVAALTAAQFEQAAYLLPQLRALASSQPILLSLQAERVHSATSAPGAILGVGGFDIHLTVRNAVPTLTSPQR